MRVLDPTFGTDMFRGKPCKGRVKKKQRRLVFVFLFKDDSREVRLLCRTVPHWTRGLQKSKSDRSGWWVLLPPSPGPLDQLFPAVLTDNKKPLTFFSENCPRAYRPVAADQLCRVCWPPGGLDPQWHSMWPPLCLCDHMGVCESPADTKFSLALPSARSGFPHSTFL